MLKFAVVWHEDRDYSVDNPRHVMGISRLFNTWEEAKKWLDDTIAQDKAYCDDQGDGQFVVHTVGWQDLWITSGAGRVTYYTIKQVIVDNMDGKKNKIEKGDKQ